MILVLEGDRNSGKNIVLAALCKEQQERGRRVVSLEENIFTFETDVITTSFLFEEVDSLQDSILVVPGPDKIPSSRTSMSKTNILFSYIVAQSRARQLDFYIATPNRLALDIRIRHHASPIGQCVLSPTWNSVWVALQELLGGITNIFPVSVGKYQHLVKIPDLPKGFLKQAYTKQRWPEEAQLADIMADITWRRT